MLEAFLKRDKPPPESQSPDEYVAYFCSEYIRGHGTIIGRLEALVHDNGTKVFGEYGSPGARILLRNGNGLFVHDYYCDKVWHIHSITKAFAENEYFVTTGDTERYLDLVRITETECALLERKRKYTGGFTTMVNDGEQIWAGTDYAERANFLTNLKTGKRFHLPYSCRKTYFVDMSLQGRVLQVVTKRLARPYGYFLQFCLDQRKFLSCKKIAISEACYLPTLETQPENLKMTGVGGQTKRLELCKDRCVIEKITSPAGSGAPAHSKTLCGRPW